MIRDSQGRSVRLTTERQRHIVERHPYMDSMGRAMEETLSEPEILRRSISDPDSVTLYYRWYPDTTQGSKWLCVVVKRSEDDAFVLTAYLTNFIKPGETL